MPLMPPYAQYRLRDESHSAKLRHQPVACGLKVLLEKAATTRANSKQSIYCKYEDVGSSQRLTTKGEAPGARC